jgi:hypothetical protein
MIGAQKPAAASILQLDHHVSESELISGLMA